METLFSLIVGRRGTVVLKTVLEHFNTFIKMVYFGWMLLHGYILWEGGVG